MQINITSGVRGPEQESKYNHGDNLFFPHRAKVTYRPSLFLHMTDETCINLRGIFLGDNCPSAYSWW